jgi:phosphatidylinositol kinase/protein kinase (PI-3  family)
VFRYLPKIFEIFIKLDNSKRLKRDERDHISNIIYSLDLYKKKELQSILLTCYNQNEYIYHIATNILSEIVYQNLEPNCYWLASYTIKPTDDNKIKKSKYNFGINIKNKLSDKEHFINNYRIFLEYLDNLMRNKKKYQKAYNIIKEINEFLNNKDIILPATENIQIDQKIYNISKLEKEKNYLSQQTVKFDMYSELYNLNNQNNDLKFTYIKYIEQEYNILESKEQPIMIKMIDDRNTSRKFVLKKFDEEIVRESKTSEVINTINQVFNFENSYDKNLQLNQNIIINISNKSILIECAYNSQVLNQPIFNEIKFQGDISYNKDNVSDMKLNVLYNYFYNKYPDPNQWYLAKKNYTISTALWSMTGYLIGLGDRHLNNILLNDKGEIIHIDFGMILNYGSLLPYKEIVPFRFTKNIRKTIGVFEENGVFSYYCFQCLKYFTNNLDTIFSRLHEMFILDPILSKMENESIHQFYRNSLIDYEQELNKMRIFGDKIIMDRLTFLINRSKSNNQLSKMFKGWQPQI